VVQRRSLDAPGIEPPANQSIALGASQRVSEDIV
jgi:hypothetical protein